MSSGRTVERKIDLDLMEKVAQNKGYKTKRNAGVMGYYTDHAMFDSVPLVISDKTSHYDVGFNGKEIMADYHGGYAQHVLEDLMPDYQKTQFEQGYVCVDKVLDMPDRIRLLVRR